VIGFAAAKANRLSLRMRFLHGCSRAHLTVRR
jgi:hypothetical protein